MDIRAGYYIRDKRVSNGPHQAMAKARDFALLNGVCCEVHHRLVDNGRLVLAYTAYPVFPELPPHCTDHAAFIFDCPQCIEAAQNLPKEVVAA